MHIQGYLLIVEDWNLPVYCIIRHIIISQRVSGYVYIHILTPVSRSLGGKFRF